MSTHAFGMKTRSTQAYCLTLALALMAALAMDVDAQSRTHAFDCKTLGGTPRDISFALQNDSTSTEMVALCAIPDTNSFPKQNITTLNVEGFDGHPTRQLVAMACVSRWFTTGGSCGPMATSPVLVGDYTLQPSRSGVWTSATFDDPGYLWVRIPDKEDGRRSSFRGYYIAY